MSEDVGSDGIMVPLTKKLSDDELEDIMEDLWENGNSIVNINYEGTLAYTDNRSDGYGISFGVSYNDDDFDIIVETLDSYDIGVDITKARSYSCYWYNGADSDMDMLTLEEFYSLTNQKSS